MPAVTAAQLGDRRVGHDVAAVRRQPQHHPVAGADAVGGQGEGDGVGAPVEVGVGHPCAAGVDERR